MDMRTNVHQLGIEERMRIWSEIESFYAKRDFLAIQTIILTKEGERHCRIRFESLVRRYRWDRSQ